MNFLKNMQQGFTLIEIVLFIIVMGTVSAGLAVVFVTSLSRVPQVGQQNKAIEVAQQRMDIILGQKANLGFSNFTDPCVSSPPAVCSFSGNYTVTSTITTGYGGNDNFKIITVTVSGDASASLTTLVGSY